MYFTYNCTIERGIRLYVQSGVDQIKMPDRVK